MKNSDGFSLIEVMAAASVLMLAAATALPMLVHVYEERLSVDQERKAIELLHNRTKNWLHSGQHGLGEEDVKKSPNTTYHLTVEKVASKNTYKFCVSWRGSHERRDQKCGYAKKTKTPDSH